LLFGFQEWLVRITVPFNLLDMFFLFILSCVINRAVKKNYKLLANRYYLLLTLVETKSDHRLNYLEYLKHKHIEVRFKDSANSFATPDEGLKRWLELE